MLRPLRSPFGGGALRRGALPAPALRPSPRVGLGLPKVYNGKGELRQGKIDSILTARSFQPVYKVDPSPRRRGTFDNRDTPVTEKVAGLGPKVRVPRWSSWQPADLGVSTSDSPNPSQPPFVAPQQLGWTPRTPRSRFRPPERSSMQCRMHSSPAHRLRSPPAHQLPPAPSHPPASQHHATKHPAALCSPMCEGVQGASLSPQHHTSAHATCETATNS